MKTVGAIYAMTNHVGYTKWIGVNVKGKLFIYGNPSKMFGSEPWLITLGDNVHITTDVMFITHDGGTLLFRDKVPDLEITAPIIVKDNVYIGVRSIVLPGVTIGENSIIAAGSIVTKNVTPNSVMGGIPAKKIKSTEEYFNGIKSSSLHLGHLKGKYKDKALKEYFKYEKID
ncbi:DapH/DapD/GlmU-related protein [Tenacibaculum sp. SG-28]|uniref:acyltransferase n=1 Tax=Tenacibaculum sp. SG-28 TaxID=754426 RepID=UPI000CF4EBA3|nr:acyltransferase [Tenacibaculum sp. SG-28]PQJ21096.1 capsule biosynthesis protein CapG [Tenacibaculum sp. SG-28]